MRTLRLSTTVTVITLIALLSSCNNKLDILEPKQSAGVFGTTSALNGHEYVDLGLSVKWATCNIDAHQPEDFGGYYAWGDDKPYSHVAHFLDSLGLKKEYFLTTNKDYIDHFEDRLKLDAVGRSLIRKGVDIANHKWGEGWRMPSKLEFDELLDNCIWQQFDTDDAVYYKVTSKIPGYTDRYIILPNAGYRFVDNETEFVDEMGYWTGTIHHYDMINLFVYNMKERFNCFSGAAVGYPVRPVCK